MIAIMLAAPAASQAASPCGGADADYDKYDLIVVSKEQPFPEASSIPNNVTWTSWDQDTYFCMFPNDALEPYNALESWIAYVEWCQEDDNCTVADLVGVPIDPVGEAADVVLPPIQAAATSSCRIHQIAGAWNPYQTTWCGVGTGPTAATNNGYFYVYSVAADGPREPSGGCNLSSINSALGQFESRFDSPSTNLNMGSFCLLPGSGQRGWPTYGSTSTSTCTHLGALESYIESEHSWLLGGRHRAIMGWVDKGGHNGCAISGGYSGSLAAGELKPYSVIAEKPYSGVNWWNAMVVQHELSHNLGGIHHPSDSGTNNCGYGGVMNYCNAYRHDKGYDAWNFDRIYYNLWE